MPISSALVSSDVAKIIAELKFRLSLASGGFFLLGLFQVGLLAYWHYNSVFMSLLNLIIFGLMFMMSIILIPRYASSALGLHFWATWSVGGIGLLLGQQVDNYLTKGMSNTEQGALNDALLGHTTTEMIPLLFTGMSIVIFIFAIPACTMLSRGSRHRNSQTIGHNQSISHRQNNSHKQTNILEQNSRLEQNNSPEQANCNPLTWCMHLGSMGLIFAAMILAAQVGKWLFADEPGNSLAEHYFNLTLLALFSTCIYHLLTKRLAMMIE